MLVLSHLFERAELESLRHRRHLSIVLPNEALLLLEEGHPNALEEGTPLRVIGVDLVVGSRLEERRHLLGDRGEAIRKKESPGTRVVLVSAQQVDGEQEQLVGWEAS